MDNLKRPAKDTILMDQLDNELVGVAGRINSLFWNLFKKLYICTLLQFSSPRKDEGLGFLVALGAYPIL